MANHNQPLVATLAASDVDESRMGQAPGQGRAPVSRGRRNTAGFTLVEVLAALLFMAVVIPVAVDGLRVASRASVLGQRKAVAAQIAQRVLNEQVVTAQGTGGAQGGVVHQGNVDYSWQLKMDVWTQGQAQSLLQLTPMQVMTVQVNFPVQGQVYNVHLSTLMNVTQ